MELVKKQSEEEIKEHDIIYQEYCKSVNRLMAKKQYEAACEQISSAALFTWFHFSGRFTDGRLENALVKIGANIESGNYIKNNSKRINRVDQNIKVLHIASELYDVGGHTKLIFNWVELDQKNCHHLLITSQEKEKIPSFISEKFTKERSKLYCLDKNMAYLDKAIQTREIGRGYDFVVLHQHPNDVVPVLAFAVQDTPPVAILNHADHTFWLGSSICDVLVELRPKFLEIDKWRRQVKETQLLPIPVKPTIKLERDNTIKKDIGIPKNSVVILTIGNEYKYRPIGNYNLFECIIDVLNENPNSYLLFIGVDKNSDLAKEYQHNQIKYLGVINDIDPFIIISDIYLETFPFSSFTALTQVGLKGVPLHLMYGKNDVSSLEGFDYIDEVGYSSGIEEYKYRLNKLLKDKKLRQSLGRKLQNKILETHGSSAWKDYLNDFYLKISEKQHKVSFVQNTKVVIDKDSWLLNRILLKDRNRKGRLLQMKTSNPIEVVRIMFLSFSIKDSSLNLEYLWGWLKKVGKTFI